MNKGIVYTVWGDYNDNQLRKSVESIRGKYDYHINDVTEKPGEHFQKRAGMYQNSPFDVTLFLDIDTIVKKNIDFGFQMAKVHSIACCVAPADCAYYASGKGKRFKNLTQFNCGVLFVYKCERSKYIFGTYSDLLKNDNAITNDQPFFSLAMSQHFFVPYVLPKGWNFRPHLRYTGETNGEIKILHK
jgi:lipopolysaccharide biosynthesis glycosyltransferase